MRVSSQHMWTGARTVALSPRVPFEVRCRLLYLYRRRSWPTRYPVTFTQKLLWKMVKDRRPLLTTFADKVAVRDYVAQAVGPEVLPQLYAVVTDPADLDPAQLPEQFVVKPNNASGLVWIVVDRCVGRAHVEAEMFTTTRQELDWDVLVATCRAWLALDYADVALEWAYRNIPPKILVEELLLNSDGQIPRDYKFLVFHGRVRLIQVHTDRFNDHRVNLFFPDWTPFYAQIPFRRADHEPPRPDSLERMVHIAETLGKETDFVRVDLYDIDGRVVFGEVTSYPAAASQDLYPESLELGQYWTLPLHYH